MARKIICLDTSILIDYFRKQNKSKSQNKLIDLPDILIGATAITQKLELATLNKEHFERIENLDLILRSP